jgi:hypothetical protein
VQRAAEPVAFRLGGVHRNLLLNVVAPHSPGPSGRHRRSVPLHACFQRVLCLFAAAAAGVSVTFVT